MYLDVSRAGCIHLQCCGYLRALRPGPVCHALCTTYVDGRGNISPAGYFGKFDCILKKILFSRKRGCRVGASMPCHRMRSGSLYGVNTWIKTWDFMRMAVDSSKKEYGSGAWLRNAKPFCYSTASFPNLLQDRWKMRPVVQMH